MVRRYVVGVLACLAAVPMSLTGCAEKHEASQTLPPVSASASPTNALPAVGPADFPVPAEARQKTPHGVQSFTRYYVELLNHQATTLDAEPLRDLSQNCQTCNELAQSYEQQKAAGHRFAGGEITVTGMGSAVVKDTGGETSFVLREAPTTVVDDAGTTVEVRSTKPSRYTGGTRLVWDEKRTTWLMAQFDADPL